MKIDNIKPFNGQHCETTATGTLLRQLEIELSEPMLFGLGQGLGFIFWNMKTMNFPFIGGRIKTDLLTQNLAKNRKISIRMLTPKKPGFCIILSCVRFPYPYNRGSKGRFDRE